MRKDFKKKHISELPSEMPWDRYLEYLRHQGGSIEIKKFDEDFEPIGPIVRYEMRNNKLIWEDSGVMFLFTDSI